MADLRAFRRRVADLMTPQVVTCSPDIQVAAAARRMTRAGVSALVVVEDGRVIGIVTQRDLMTKVLATGLGTDRPVRWVMSAPVLAVHPGDSYAIALVTMVRHRIKHLPVLEADGALMGMVTLTDLARGRDTGALAVVDGLERAEDLGGLERARDRADGVVRALLSEGAPPREILSVATEFNDRLHRRVAALAQAELAAGGLEPPVPYSLLVMGSGGRREQYVRTDQDNGLVWLDPAPGKAQAAADYFGRLGDRIAELLLAVGFAVCPGKVMTSNPEWRRPLSGWLEEVGSWVETPVPERIRQATIFFDFRGVGGEAGPGEALRDAAVHLASQSPLFLHHLARDDLQHQVPRLSVGWLAPLFGRRRGEMDLKTDVGVHLVDGLRILALRAGQQGTSTPDRLRGAVEREELHQALGELLDSAFDTLMSIRIRRGLRPEPRHTVVRLHELGEVDRRRLREAIQATAHLQEHIRLLFHVRD